MEELFQALETTAIFTRGQPAEHGLQPGSSCVRSRLQVRGREPRGAERRGAGRGEATHSSRFSIQDWRLRVDNSIPVGLGVRPRPRLGGLAVSLAPALGTHPPPPPRVPGGSGPCGDLCLRRERVQVGLQLYTGWRLGRTLPARNARRKTGRTHLRPFPTPNAGRGRVRERGCGKEEPWPGGSCCSPIPGPHAHPRLLSLGLVPAPMLGATCPPWASSPRLDLRDVSSLAEAQAWRLHSQVFPHPSRRR